MHFWDPLVAEKVPSHFLFHFILTSILIGIALEEEVVQFLYKVFLEGMGVEKQ